MSTLRQGGRMSPWKEGDWVHIGKSKTIWIITGQYTTWDGDPLITLTKLSNGYVNTSATPERLTPVQNGGNP